MVETTTWLGSKVNIPNCTVCNTWLGSNNSIEKIPTFVDKGCVIIIGDCQHTFHGNCITQNECHICSKKWTPIDKINIFASDWWIVDNFWKTHFSSKE